MKETRGGGEFAELMERAVLKERVRVRGGSAGLKERRGEDGLRQGEDSADEGREREGGGLREGGQGGQRGAPILLLAFWT